VKLRYATSIKQHKLGIIIILRPAKQMEDNDGSDTAGEEVAEEEAAAAVDEWRGVYVVRYDGGGPMFKHWALYVVDEVDHHAGFLCHLEGLGRGCSS
jgi:hypothetical protein